MESSEHEPKEPRVGEFYRHYKGGKTPYRVVAVAHHTGAAEPDAARLVVYCEPSYTHTWARPLREWFEVVDAVRDGKPVRVPRFTKIEPAAEAAAAYERAGQLTIQIEERLLREHLLRADVTRITLDYLRHEIAAEIRRAEEHVRDALCR